MFVQIEKSSKMTQVSDTTYNLLYIDYHYERAFKVVRNVFNHFERLKINIVVDYLIRIVFNDQSGNIQVRAHNILTQILSNRPVIYNKLGFRKYLRERNGYLYLSDNLGDIEDYNLSYYSVNKVVSYQQNLNDHFEPYIVKNVEEKVKNLNANTLMAEFNKANIITKIYIFERSIKRQALAQSNEADQMLLNKTKQYYLRLKLPINKLQATKTMMYKSRPGTRPRLGFWQLTNNEWKKIKSLKEPTNVYVYIHYAKIFELQPASRKSGTNRYSNRIRILRRPYTKWKTISYELNPVGQTVYQNIIEDQIKERRNVFIDKIRGHYPLNHYSVTQVEESFFPVYFTYNPFTKEYSMMADTWFRSKYEPGVKQPPEPRPDGKKDSRRKPKGRSILPEGPEQSHRKAIYEYFYQPNKGDPEYDYYENRGKDILNKIVEIAERLGIVDWKYN